METTAVRTTEYEISAANAIGQFLVDAYGTSMRIRSGDDDRHLFRHRRTEAGAFALEVACQSADLEFEVEPLNTIVVTRTTTSRLERDAGGAHRRYGTGQLFVMSHPDQPYTARWMPGEIQNCIIDPAQLARVAVTASTRRVEPARFTSLDAGTPALAAHWWATRSYVADLLANPEASAAPLVIASAGQLLAAATLATFPNTAVTDPGIQDRRDASTQTLRRAVAFIDEHAADNISVADVATAANVTIRAVQLAFRRHLDMTPMQYLRRVRLNHAHHDLITADPATATVTTIAYQWGFTSPSRFAALYRQAYGITPSRILRRD
jgi:AraC-like DNA-binding protein